MKGQSLEAFLAKLYIDKAARARFLSDRRGEATKAGLTEEEIQALENIDDVGLSLMAESLERKNLAKANKTKLKNRFLSRFLKLRR